MNIGHKIGKTLTIICAIAMIWISFAHRPVVTLVTDQTVNLSAYTLPDGTIPIICFGGEGDGESTSYQGCEYCRLADTVISPASPQVFVRVVNTVRVVSSASEKIPLSKSIRLAGAPQTGPPLFSI